MCVCNLISFGCTITFFLLAIFEKKIDALAKKKKKLFFRETVDIKKMANLNKAVEDLMAQLEAVSGRLQAVEGKLAGGVVASSAASSSSSSSSPAASGDDGSSSPAVQGFDDLISEFIKPFEAATPKFGTDKLKEQVGLFVQAVNDQRSLIGIAATSKKPDAATFQGLIAKCGELMQQVVAIRNSSHKYVYVGFFFFTKEKTKQNKRIEKKKKN
jgi:CAP, N-terminal domain